MTRSSLSWPTLPGDYQVVASPRSTTAMDIVTMADNRPFARDVPREVADAFVADPFSYAGPLAPLPQIRGSMLDPQSAWNLDSSLEVTPLTPTPQVTVVPCRTLGALWRDLVAHDGSLYASQVEAETATAFAADPTAFPLALADEPTMRGWVLVRFHRWLHADNRGTGAPR